MGDEALGGVALASTIEKLGVELLLGKIEFGRVLVFKLAGTHFDGHVAAVLERGGVSGFIVIFLLDGNGLGDFVDGRCFLRREIIPPFYNEDCTRELPILGRFEH